MQCIMVHGSLLLLQAASIIGWCHNYSRAVNGMHASCLVSVSPDLLVLRDVENTHCTTGSATRRPSRAPTDLTEAI